MIKKAIDIDLKKVPECLRNPKDHILVFDDLERCAMSIENILGYINRFVEHQGMKVIIVANEEKILANGNDTSSDGTHYEKIKEKLIGKTFTVLPAVDSALCDFTKRVSDRDTRQFLKGQEKTIIYAYDLSGYKNLRYLRQSLLDFERLCRAVSKEHKRVDGLLVHLLQHTLAFSFEIRHSEIAASDITGMTAKYYSELFARDNQHTTISRFIAKYAPYGLGNPLLSEECWTEFFDRGFVDAQAISDSLSKSAYFLDENTPSWVKLWNFRELTDEQFLELIEHIESEYDSASYEDIGVFVHIVGALMQLSDSGLYNRSKEEILSRAKHYTDQLKRDMKLPPNKISFPMQSYGGKGFQGTDFDEFKEFFTYVERKIEEAYLECLPREAENLLKIMKEDNQKFYRMICISNSSDQKYYNTPIFKYIDPDEYIKALLSIEASNRRYPILAMDERYKYDNINKEIEEELPWLISVRDKMISESELRKGKISGYFLDMAARHYFCIWISKLKECNAKQQ